MSFRKNIAWCIISLIIVLLFPSPSYAKTITIRVGFPEIEGISEYDTSTGVYSGSSYEFLKKFQRYINWEYEFITGTEEEILNMVKNGEVDLACGFSIKEDLTQYMDYPEYTSGISYTAITAEYSNPIIDVYDYESFNNKIIGILRSDTEQIDALDRFCETNGITLNYLYYDSADSWAQCLQNGEADLKLSSDIAKNSRENEYIAVKFNPLYYYFVTPKGNPEFMRKLNTCLKRVYDEYPAFEYTLYRKYFENMNINEIYLTNEEKVFIAEKEKVKVVFNKDLPPFQYRDRTTGEYRGISLDVLNMITDRTGLEFELIPMEDADEALRLLETGEADAIAGLMKGYGVEDSAQLIISNDYLSAQNVMLKNTKSSINHISRDGTVALPKLYAGADAYKKLDHVILYDNMLDCIKAVQDGDADFTYINEHTAQYYMDGHTSKNLSMLGTVDSESDVCFGFYYKDDSVTLLHIFNKAIQAISSADARTMIYENVTTVKHHFSWSRFAYQNPFGFTILCMISIMLLLSIVFAVFTSRQKKKLTESLRKQQLYEKQIREALSYAENASTMKTQFLSNMSHEIRTPLNGIIGMTKLTMEMKGLPEHAKRNLGKLKTSSDHLLSLVNEILDMSRIESGKVTLDKKVIPLHTFYISIETIIRQQAYEKGLSFHINANDKHCPAILGDDLRLKQILINLLSNSVKYTEPGGSVTLLAETIKEEQNCIYMRFTISDTGIGMSEDFIKNAFDPFVQSTVNQAKYGSGLGLAITKNLVEMMGGHIHLESTPGKGTTITLSLCFEIPSPWELKRIEPDFTVEEKSTVQTVYDFTGHRILLVEDNELNLEIETVLLEQVHTDIDTASNGQEALDLFEQSAPYYYEAILMDIQMPVLDGLSATQQLRKLNRPDAKNITIIAMTANAFKEDVNQSLANGMNYHISKPFEPEKLYAILQTVFQSQRQ